MNPDYLKHKSVKKFGATALNMKAGLLPGVSAQEDEALITEYLEYFFVESSSFKPYQLYLSSDWLQVLLQLDQLIL